MFIAGRACVSLRKCEAAKRRAHPFNDTALSTTAGSCRSSWAENGKRCKQETQKWKCHGESLDCKYLEASVSTCTYSDNSISNQPKNIKEQYLRYQASQMEHIEIWSWMYWWEETPLLKSTAQASDANWSDKGLLATAASTISWEWETGNKLQKCPGRLQPKSSA